MVDPEVHEALVLIARYVPALQNGTFQAGEWSEPKDLPDGSMVMPYFEFGPDLLGFIGSCRHLMLRDFKWTAWINTDEGVRVRDNIENATVHELRQMVHASIRQDRFVEGLLAELVRSGYLLKLARRAQTLLDKG
jgi:hypothetical protein